MNHKVSLQSLDKLRYRSVFVSLAVFWLCFVSVSCYLSIKKEKQNIREHAIIEGRAGFNKDQVYRKWVAGHGGVYVPVTEQTPPNPYLEHIRERDIQTPSGKLLTLVNPAYMTRQVHALSLHLEGSRGRLTSLDPLRPENAPDEWERQALLQVEKGVSEVCEVAQLNGEPYLRTMHAFVTRKECLKCHAQHGFEEGDIRGGITVDVPLKPFLKIGAGHIDNILLEHGINLFLGLLFIGMGAFFIGKRVEERRKAEDALLLDEERLEALVKMGTMPKENEGELCIHAVKEAVRLTRSQGGYVRLMDPVQMKFFAYPAHYHNTLMQLLRQTLGNFDERKERSDTPPDEPIVRNQVHHLLPAADGVQGQTIQRYLYVPVIDEGKVVAVAGVVNKHNDYDEADIRQLTLFMGNLWGTFKQMRSLVENQQLEARLRQSQKMEAIGTLAGGIAHDFNNILTALLGYTELIREDKTLRERTGQYAEQVYIAGQRARDLVKQILAFSRQSESEKRPLNLEYVIKEVLQLLRASLPANIQILQEIDRDCGVVLVDPTQIHQVVMNLCTNAFHAMQQKGGTLGVKLHSTDVHEGENKVATGEIQPGTYAVIEVSDTGCGMGKAVLERIFEPYFTTKEKGRGTGLGLAIVHGIVKDHGGYVSVYSEIGKGCSFKIYLPVIEDMRRTKVLPQPLKLPVGSESILLVDDEQTITGLASDMLKGLGYTVTAVNDPIEAFNLYKKNPTDYDLVITDMSMPAMSGVDLAGKLLQLNKDLPIILCTGFSEMINRKEAARIGIRRHIMKPVLKKDIAVIVRDVLDESSF